MPKKIPPLTAKERAYLKKLSQGMTQIDAARGIYSANSLSQGAHNALESIKRKMPSVMEKLGLTDEALVKKHLLPLLDAKETRFFAFRKIVWTPKEKVGTAPPELVQHTEQVVEEREVEALGIRATALDMAFKLKGSYAPKQVDFDPEASNTVTVINTSAIPRHG